MFIRSPVKLAVLSQALPPAPSVNGVLIYRILKNLNPDDYCLLSDKSYKAYSGLRSSSSTATLNSVPRLPAQYYQLSSDPLRERSKLEAKPPNDEPPATMRLGKGLESSLAKSVRSKIPDWLKSQTVRELINYWRTAHRVVMETLAGLRRARKAAHVLRRERCGAILAPSGEPFDLPAGYLASRLARVPFYAYLFDDYLHQWDHTVYHSFARLAEPIVLKGAAGVITPNEFLRDEYRRRYGIEPTIIRNSIEISQKTTVKEADDAPPWPAEEGEIRIVYTGTVSMRYHHDAFRNLIEAIEQLGRSEVKLHLYTAQTREELESGGIGGPTVHHGLLPSSDVREVQRKADVLFLPLAFNSSVPEVIRTSSPGKMGEYLASGRPILAHAPTDSFVSWYIREHECGVVVDQSEPAVLARAIQRIFDDSDLRRKIGQRARARAESDFSLESAQAEFLKLLRAKMKKKKEQ